MASSDDLARALLRIDGRSYRAYKEIGGSWHATRHELHIDHVQGDPFAAPSKLRIRVPMAEAGLPRELFEKRTRRIALADFLGRRVRGAIRAATGRREGSGKSGRISIDAGGQEVLERSAVAISADWVEARCEVGLPAAGRRILGRAARTLLLETLPRVAMQGLLWEELPRDEARRFVECVENQEHIRGQLAERQLVAFVANGSILPRASGADDAPLARERAVPFASPPSLEVAFELPNPVALEASAPVAREAGGPAARSKVVGMGIPRGVTLIVGGGYHGKSTLLRALERAVYPHIPGDGREGVVADPGLVKIRAEDGRRVEGVDIHPFIKELPRLPASGAGDGASEGTRAFRSQDASGSTSQAANIVEALEVGASGLLLDEDTSATNFMLRDARMQALVSADREPITPFLERVREIYERLDVSTILVMGGCGDYFDVADHVVMMSEYCASEVTEEARRVATERPTGRQVEAQEPLRAVMKRVPLAESFDPSRGRRAVKIDARGLDLVRYGDDEIDLRAVHQLVDPSQTRAIGLAVHQTALRWMDGRRSLAEILAALDALLDEGGLDPLDPHHRPGRHPGNLARPRRFEVAAAINRLRSLRVL